MTTPTLTSPCRLYHPRQIDEVSDGTNGVGVTWHVELNGIPFPFGRGCSFIKLVRPASIFTRTQRALGDAIGTRRLRSWRWLPRC